MFSMCVAHVAFTKKELSQRRKGRQDGQVEQRIFVTRQELDSFFGARIRLRKTQRREIVSLPKATPRSQPRPLPLSARDTSPFVMTCAFADFTAPACASAATYDPSTSSML